MTDIEERAHFAEKDWLLSEDVTRYGYEQGYIKGATEQRKIDIDKVCDLLVTALNEGMLGTGDIGRLNTWIRQAMEE